jgi:hypothetical protein
MSGDGELEFAHTGEALLRKADAARGREQMYAVRKRVNTIALTLSLLAMEIGRAHV